MYPGKLYSNTSKSKVNADHLIHVVENKLSGKMVVCFKMCSESM